MLKVYLAGEIHSDWRNEIVELCEKDKLDIVLEIKFFLLRAKNYLINKLHFKKKN